MSGRIDLIGTDQYLAELRRRLGSAAARVENKALRTAGEPIAAEMKSLVNVSDRNNIHLRDDIRVSRVVRKQGVKYVLIGSTKRTSWRGHFLEWGTTEHAARPYVEPAFHAKKRVALEKLADGFRKGLRE